MIYCDLQLSKEALDIVRSGYEVNLQTRRKQKQKQVNK